MRESTSERQKKDLHGAESVAEWSHNQPKMNTQLHYEETTVAELIERTSRNGGTVLVSFPFNDYRTSHGTKAFSPSRKLKLLTDKRGTHVRFSGLKWDITGVKALVKTNEDGTTYRHLMVTTINAR